jgi:hypothetical protein
LWLHQALYHPPDRFRLVAKKHDFILALIKIEPETSFYFTRAGSKVSTCYVVDVNYESATLRVGELNKFHLAIPQKRE